MLVINNEESEVKKIGPQSEKLITLALAGNANVGKSAIFNQLTGLVQETGNWAGKTVEIKEGRLFHHNREFRVVDLPGVYSFAGYSPDEMVTRRFILKNQPDVIINVLDATSLERNLYYTLQLKEMGLRCVIALNYADIARKKHIHIDQDKLSSLLGYPVINTVAIKGIGVHELVDAALQLIESPTQDSVKEIKYGPEIESRTDAISRALLKAGLQDNTRWRALKLLEKDPEISGETGRLAPDVLPLVAASANELAAIHGEDSSTVIASERYAAAAQINRQISRLTGPEHKVTGIFDNLTLHPVGGYFVFVLTMIAILVFISLFGGWISGLITRLFESFNPHAQGPLGSVLWNGSVVGFYAALSVAVGFILPFYFILSWLGESGYLPRMAFMLDRPCHTIGLHGQASLPLIMGFGCNVPACLSCRILENRRDRLIATFLSTLVPCSARSSVVLGLVGAFIGWEWAIGLFLFQFIIIFLIGKILNRLFPSSSPGIIMEIPDFRNPALKVVWRQAWYKFKDFLTIGIPLIVAGSMVIEALQVFHWMDYITRLLNPVTVWWLGLPAFSGVILIFGILRKEANLALLISMADGAAVSSIMTPVQMVVFAIVIMLYIPCISTIAALLKETGWKLTLLIVVVEILLAVLIGGLAARLLPFVLS
jgi:ferrous iron transport protein B